MSNSNDDERNINDRFKIDFNKDINLFENKKEKFFNNQMGIKNQELGNDYIKPPKWSKILVLFSSSFFMYKLYKTKNNIYVSVSLISGLTIYIIGMSYNLKRINQNTN